jgi:hypothetical protein
MPCGITAARKLNPCRNTEAFATGNQNGPHPCEHVLLNGILIELAPAYQESS